jgi:hypothetical protein
VSNTNDSRVTLGAIAEQYGVPVHDAAVSYPLPPGSTPIPICPAPARAKQAPVTPLTMDEAEAGRVEIERLRACLSAKDAEPPRGSTVLKRALAKIDRMALPS